MAALFGSPRSVSIFTLFFFTRRERRTRERAKCGRKVQGTRDRPLLSTWKKCCRGRWKPSNDIFLGLTALLVIFFFPQVFILSTFVCIQFLVFVPSIFHLPNSRGKPSQAVVFQFHSLTRFPLVFSQLIVLVVALARFLFLIFVFVSCLFILNFFEEVKRSLRFFYFSFIVKLIIWYFCYRS